MLIVLPFCNKDVDAAAKNLLWIAELDGCVKFQCLLAWPDSTNPESVEKMRAAARKAFVTVHEFTYPEATETTWPAGPNWAWQQTAAYIRMSTAYKGNTYPLPQVFPDNTPWLFLEADAIPLKEGWIQTLLDEYVRGGQPFMGHIVQGMGHMNGVAIYPNHVAHYAKDAMHCVHAAWDAVLREQTIEVTHAANSLIQHCWVLRNHDTPMHFGEGPAPSFRDVGHMTRILEPNAVLFHRCKDGSLIDCLMQRLRNPERLPTARVTLTQADLEKIAKALDEEEFEPIRTPEKTKGATPDGAHSGAVATTPVQSISYRGESLGGASGVISAQARETVSVLPPSTGTTGDSTPVPGPLPKVSIFIVTYHKDAPWLKYCLASIKKFATGFLETVVVFPDRDTDVEAIEPVCQESGVSNLSMDTFSEVEGKGMIHHMAIECMADQFCAGDLVLHIDSDCLFIEPVTPLDYIVDGRPVLLMEAYERFREKYPTILKWKEGAEAALQFPCEYETMRRHPAVHLRAVYPGTRKQIEKAHNKPFVEYVLSCKPDFPQGFSEFNVLGAYALKFFKDEYFWIDAATALRPTEKIWQGWSHGGFDRPSDTGMFIPDTPRQVFKKVLGL